MEQSSMDPSARLLLSELYITWASDPKYEEKIRQTMVRLLALAKQPRPATESSRHVDPMSDSAGPLTSPPSTPPNARRKSNEDQFTMPAPSPHGREGSAGAPSVREASPPATQPLSSPRFTETAMGAVAVPIDLPIITDLSASATARDTHSMSRHMHSNSGVFAASPPPDTRQASRSEIPMFYCKNESKGLRTDGLTEEEELLSRLLSTEPHKTIRKAHFGDICANVFKVPIWLKEMLFETVLTHAGLPVTNETLTEAVLSEFYRTRFGGLTPSRRLFELIRQDSRVEHVTLEDLKRMAKYLVESHPGLEFLQQPEFQDYYCRTVAIRIMYMLERQQNRRITWRDFDRSNLPEVMLELDTKDVNQVLEYFSYEHFYVLYCKFWELDTDRDLLVDYADLCNYGQGSVVPAVIRRVVEGCGRPLTSEEPGHLDFEDFVYFCLSEEDKNSEAAIYYWFKVLDLDGDGILSGYELFQFYRENRQRFLEYSENPEGDIAYEDMVCQMLDMLGYDRVSQHTTGVTLGDLRACPAPANFFNMIFNAPKFMMFEHRDPFGEHQQKLRPEKTDWDRFARAEYDRMAAEAQ